MSSYLYSPLTSDEDNIRLLCLLPNENEAAPLQCAIRKYTLPKLDTGTHLYEALSYVWGNPKDTLPICVDGDQFPVTVNLHAALSRLRDRSFERVIWVDAICINQSNLEERKQQIGLMAKIYSKAHRVIVWLGKEAVDTKGALEDICLAANDELTERSRKEIDQQAILSLLQRPWFQRIWVLQEVAAARHVVMMCGSMEIDGYAFCLGLKALKLSYTASIKSQTLLSVIYLIERAGLRSKFTTNSAESFSLNICSLAELIDMFHTREASDIHDKLYALFGMSSDSPIEAGLRPDYKVPWKELFQKLVKFVLGKDVSVETSDHTQRAVIKSKGCIIGQVSSVRSDDRQNTNITFESENTAWCLGDKVEWSLQQSAKSIRERDIICILQGASKPTIIRLYGDHFAIVMIAVTPLKESRSYKNPEFSKQIIQFPREFLLVWDWEALLEEPQDAKESKNWMSLNRANRIWNVALILGDSKQYENAEKWLREAIKGYEVAFGEEHPFLLKSKYGLTPLSWAAGNGYEAIVRLLLANDSIDPDLMDSEYGQTPLSWAAERGHEAVVKLLLETNEVEVDAKDKISRTPLSWAAGRGHEAVVKLLLETNKVEVDAKDNTSRTPLWRAANGGHQATVKLLLEIGKVEIDSGNEYGRTPLWVAAFRGHQAVIMLLLETSRVQVNSADKYGETPLWAAANEGHQAVVKILLETCKVEVDSRDEHSRTPLWIAAFRGHQAVVMLLLETGKVEINSRDENRQTPLCMAAIQGYDAIVKILLETGKAEVNFRDIWGQTPLWTAANRGHEAVVKILLKTGKADVNLKDNSGDTPLMVASKEGHEAIVQLLKSSSG